VLVVLRIEYENKSAEKFLANCRFWNYTGKPEATAEPWEFDAQKSEQSMQGLRELRSIALLLVNELDFLSPPIPWSGHTRRARWGSLLVEGNFDEWKKVKKRSAQIRATIFYPSRKRNYDFMLCVNKYTPLALTRIQDADVRANKKKLEPIWTSVGLQFDYTTDRPVLLPQKPESCSLDEVSVFAGQLERFRGRVGCSIRNLGEFPRFG